MSAEFFNVKIFSAATDFFVRCDGKTEFGMGDFGVFNKVAGRFNDNAMPALSSGSQKRGAVSDNKLFSGIFGHTGEALKAQNDVFVLI